MIFLQFLILPPQPDERADDLVDAEYVARRFGCSKSSVYAGKCGTGEITPVMRDPWRAVRAQVEEVHRARVADAARKTPGQRAIRLLNRKGGKTRAA